MEGLNIRWYTYTGKIHKNLHGTVRSEQFIDSHVYDRIEEQIEPLQASLYQVIIDDTMKEVELETIIIER